MYQLWIGRSDPQSDCIKPIGKGPWLKAVLTATDGEPGSITTLMPVSQLDCWTVNEMEETTKCLLYIYITDQAWRPCKEMCYGPGSNFKLELLQSG